LSIIRDLDEDERYLWAILSDETGIDMAEFLWEDHTNDSGVYRLYDYQWEMYNCKDTYQVTRGGRSVGKSVSIQMRCCAFALNFPGQDMLLTAPELNHLKPLTSAIEDRLKGVWITRELLPKSAKSDGFTRQPHWEVKFTNGAKIVSRLPGISGKGCKGQHVIWMEIDELQDYPDIGFSEAVECLNRFQKGATWRVHGVPRGVRDRFYEITDGGDSEQWTLHTPMAMNRPTWNAEERDEKIGLYGGSRQAPNYRRNIYGEHGDASSPVFVLSRFMKNIDQDSGSEYNTDVYYGPHIQFEDLYNGDVDPVSLLHIPGSHKTGWSGSPNGYSAYYGGMDVGGTSDPSEILIFGQRAKSKDEHLDLLLRVNLQRISQVDQKLIVDHLFEFYGSKLQTFGIDRTGMGHGLWDNLVREHGSVRVVGFHFSEKQPVALEDRPLAAGEELKDLIISRPVIEYATDCLREIIDANRFLLPFDRELLLEWQGQSYSTIKSSGDPYGRKKFTGGSFHTLDGAKAFIAAKRLAALTAMLAKKEDCQEDVVDIFVGL